MQGDICDFEADVIVNAWNRNIIPWWLLLPQGVSGAIKKKGGYGIFHELGRKGPIPLGGAVATGAGRLKARHIIHVAGISMLWIASERSIRASARNALVLALDLGAKTIAMPLIGAGTGGKQAANALTWMLEEIEAYRQGFESVRIVVFDEKLFHHLTAALDQERI